MGTYSVTDFGVPAAKKRACPMYLLNTFSGANISQKNRGTPKQTLLPS
jgi:hypothetical protein